MEPNPTESADLLSILLKNTEEGVLLFRAVRDSAHEITDFSFELFNEQALRFTQREANAIRGKNAA